MLKEILEVQLIDALDLKDNLKKIEMRKDKIKEKLYKALEKKYISVIEISDSGVDIEYKDAEFIITQRSIKAVESLGYRFEQISTYGSKGISINFTSVR